RVDLLERHPAFLSLLVEETKLDSLRDLGEEREVRPGPVEAGPERISPARPDLQVNHALRSRPPCNRVHRASRAQPGRPAGTGFGRPRFAPERCVPPREGAAATRSNR